MKEFFYISNLLSLSRFLLLAVTIFFLLNNNYSAGIIFIMLIWISDLLDGYFARKRNEISELGKIIDPIADKTAVIVIVLTLLYQGIIPLWYVIITILRDIIILTGGMYLKTRKNIVLQSNRIGKTAVFTIGLTLFFAILLAGGKSLQFGNYIFYHTEFVELLYTITLLLSVIMICYSLTSYFNRFLTIFKN